MKRRWRIPLSAALGLLTTTLMGAAAPAQTSSVAPAAYSHVQSASGPVEPEQRSRAGSPKAALLPTDEGDDYRRFCAGVPFVEPDSFCGDPRLGPRRLPHRGLIGSILVGYHRLGGRYPADFLHIWWNSSAQSYIFPPDSGFDHDASGNPIRTNVDLRAGQRVDRFGSESGNFLSPAGTPYKERALPPSNLNTFDGTYPFNYHLYKVVKPFTVAAGPVAPWFGQPGEGLQYQTAATQSVGTLVQQGFLRRLN